MSNLPPEIPSPIDVHVHLRQPGGEEMETIESGSLAAIIGGYMAIFDMPNNPGQPTHTRKRLKEKHKIARETSYTDFGAYAGVDLADPDIDEIHNMILYAAGLKLYMGHTTGNKSEFTLDHARPVIDEWVAQAATRQSKLPILLHAREGIGSDMAEYIAKLGHHAHWCHVATENEANMASELTQKYGEFFTAGVTPHHLIMTQRNADFQQGWFGARMQPPLGRDADADALLHGYNNGTIQILETDHAPHLTASKSIAERENPEGKTDPDCVTCFGVSGIEFVIPAMSKLVKNGKVLSERLIDSLHHQPLRMIGNAALSARAAEATTVIDSDVEPYQISEMARAGKSSNTPYIGFAAHAKVVGVKRNGIIVGRSTVANDHGPIAIIGG